MYKSKSERNIRAGSANHIHQACGNVGRGSHISNQNTGQRQSLTSLHKVSRPQSGTTSRQGAALPGGWSSAVTTSRPGSAKHWAERRWLQQEKQELRKIEYEEANNNIRAAQFRADFFNSKPSAPRLVGQLIS